MRRFFTKHFLLAVFSFVAFDMMAQINTLTVNSPASAEGDYYIVRAEFGSQDDAELSGDAIFATDGTDPTGTELCGDATNDLTGKFAFIDRGTCNFSLKVLNAQKGGAIAAIVCNNAANANETPLIMATGDFGDQVTIPAFMTNYATCQKIRASILAGEVDVTIRHLDCFNKGSYPANTVWGNGADENGNRGDFAGGLNGWTVEKSNTWYHSPKGDIIGGAYIGTAGKQTLIGWTGCDGAMVMNSDSLDTGGVAGGVGPCAAPCTGVLVSPNITLPAGIVGLTVEFSQALRQFRSEYNLYTSKDNGVTWSAPIKFNEEHPTNSAHLQQRKAIKLIGFAGASQIKLKFEYIGNYYYWAIDDVILKNEVAVDAKINTNFFAVAPTLRVPASQVVPMYFLTDISNLGNADAENLDVSVVINDEAGFEAGRLVKNYGTVAAGTAAENGLFEDTFTPDANPQFYSAYYEIKTDNDVDLKNNKADFFFEVTDNTFGNLLPEDAVSTPNYMKDITEIWAVTPTNYMSAGNIYYMPKGQGYTVDKVRFGLKNSIDEIQDAGFIQVELYEWNDEDNDGGCAPHERTLVGANNIYLDGDVIDNPRLIELPLWAVDDEGNTIEDQELQLRDDQTYFLVAHTRPLDPAFPRFQFLTYNGFALDNALDRSTYPWPVNFALDSAGVNRIGGSLFEHEGVDIEDEAERSFDFLGNTQTLFSLATMYLEMDIKQANSTYNVAKTGTAHVYPNPAVKELYIDVTLDNVSDVRVELISIEGKVVLTKSFDGVQDSRLRMDLSTVTSGAYTAMIHTNNGVIAKKVVVQK